MTKTTTTDIDRIISGAPIPIDMACPLEDIDGWHMKQPEDWLSDMADAVYSAAYAQAMALPEVEAVKGLPPTDDWIEQQREAIEADRKRIKELEAIEHRTPEDDLELMNLRAHEAVLIRPEDYSRAEQIAHNTATKAQQSWLMPRLIIDDDGDLLFDPNTEDGKSRWLKLGRQTRQKLVSYLQQVQVLAFIAKN